MTLKLPLYINQGATFIKSVNWYGGGSVSLPIEAVDVGCPTYITVIAHDLPTGETPIDISNVKGVSALNAKKIRASYVDADTISVAIDTRAKTYREGTGSIRYEAPTPDLDLYTARLNIRSRVGSETVLLSLTDGNGITLEANGAKITITITDAQTEEFSFLTAVYDLELEAPDGTVTRLLEGPVYLSLEVTRD